MNLLQPLVAGVRGAENGSVAILTRSGARATYYTNFDGSGAVTPTGDVTLDANGGLVAYVNQLVDVTVKSSSGTTVRSFTAGVSAPDVEVLSDSFTGIDYGTGQSGSSKPTTLQAILDKWDDSAGADDFKVLVSGVATNLSAVAAATLTATFYNVKSSTYGALGDVGTDDTSAIQAALTAAGNAGGGIVFFPVGSYKTTAALTVPAGVSFLGAGASCTWLLLAHATANTLNISGDDTRPSFIRDMMIAPSQSNSGNIINASTSIFLRIDACKLGLTGSSTTGKVISCTINGSQVVITGSTLAVAGAAAIHINTSLTTLAVSGCEFQFPATFNGACISTDGGLVFGNAFRASTITAGTCTMVSMTSGTTLGWCIAGNHFQSVGGGGVPTVFATQSPANAAGVVEAGNTYGSGYTWTGSTVAVTLTPSSSSHEGASLASRAVRSFHAIDNTTPIALASSQYGYAEVERTNNSAQTISFNDPPGPGQWFTLALNNNQVGASGLITMGGTNIKGIASFSVNANRVSYYHFRSVEVGHPAAALYWSLVGSDVNETP